MQTVIRNFMKKLLLLILPIFPIISVAQKIDTPVVNNSQLKTSKIDQKTSDSLKNDIKIGKINDTIKYDNVATKNNSNERRTKLIFEIIAALGSVATFGSFVYLFSRDKDKQAQIDELTKIVSSLTSLKNIENQKLNLSVRPDIKQTGGGYQGYDGEWHLDIENIGEKTTLTKLELISEGLILHNEHIPYVMEKNTTRKIFARTNTEKHVKDCEFVLNIHHTDKIGNLHIVTFKGIGASIKERITKNCI